VAAAAEIVTIRIRGLNVERTVPRAEEVDDPARQVEQRAAPLPRRKNPQCGPLVEPYDLSGFFEANGCSASQTHKDGLPGTKARLGPRRHRLKRTTLRSGDGNLALCRDDGADCDLAPGLRRCNDRLETETDQQAEYCDLSGAAPCWPPTKQSAHPAFRGTEPLLAAASLYSDLELPRNLRSDLDH